MKYRIVLKCSNAKDADKFDRELNINNFSHATDTFQSLVNAAMKELIDPYIVEFYYGDQLAQKFEKFKL